MEEMEPVENRPAAAAEAAPEVEATPEMPARDVECQGQLEEWRDRALRLQAEMDNYRKRQQRLAQDQIDNERQRLLGAFLRVVDDLERALAAPSPDGEDLRRGLELTHRAALQLLQSEGVEEILAHREPFDPTQHEAIATTASSDTGAGPNTVAHVMEPGYRIGDQLLRPAKVVVAV